MKRFFLKTARLLGWFFLALYLAVALLPKTELYYLLESKLSPLQIYINGEEVSDRLLWTSIEGGEILYQDIEAVTLQHISLTTLLLYNSLTVSPFSFRDELSAFVPPKVESLSVTHSILSPHLLHIHAKGDFGEATGYVDLFRRIVRIDFAFAPVMSRNHAALLGLVKRDKGGYFYEQAF